MIYLAYRVSTHHHYGERASETHEQLLDADADQHALIKRVNAHFALPSVLRGERGVRHEIPAFAMASAGVYVPGGGGTDYTARLEIRPAPTLVKTHRAREALWYGRKDAQGKFKPDQKFGEWELITARHAETFSKRDSYEVEPLLPADAGKALDATALVLASSKAGAAAAAPSAAPGQYLWRVYNQGWPRGHEEGTNEWCDWSLISAKDAMGLAGEDDNNVYEFVPFLPQDPRKPGVVAPDRKNPSPPLPACATCKGAATTAIDGEEYQCGSCWGTGVQMNKNEEYAKQPGWKLHRCPDDMECRAGIGGGCALGFCGHFSVKAETLYPNIIPPDTGVPPYRTHTTEPAESLCGIALRQLGDETRWTEIRDLNAGRFPDMLGSDYYPVGTVLKLPPRAGSVLATEPSGT